MTRFNSYVGSKQAIRNLKTYSRALPDTRVCSSALKLLPMFMSSFENERTVIALGGRVTLKRIPAGARKNVSRLSSCGKSSLPSLRSCQGFLSPSESTSQERSSHETSLTNQKQLNVFSDHNLVPALISKSNRDVLVCSMPSIPSRDSKRNPHRRGLESEEK